MDWRDVAKGIPLFPGALVRGLVVDRDGVEREVEARALWQEDAQHWRVRHAFAEGTMRDGVLALNDPDTQPAYLRRLAVRLGCPEKWAAEGVVFGPDGEGNWMLGAGMWILDSGRAGLAWARRIVLDEPTPDRLLALALAWPKEGA